MEIKLNNSETEDVDFILSLLQQMGASGTLLLIIYMFISEQISVAS